MVAISSTTAMYDLFQALAAYNGQVQLSAAVKAIADFRAPAAVKLQAATEVCDIILQELQPQTAALSAAIDVVLAELSDKYDCTFGLGISVLVISEKEIEVFAAISAIKQDNAGNEVHILLRKQGDAHRVSQLDRALMALKGC